MKRVFDFYPRLRIDYEISFKSYNITIKCFTQINRSDYIPNKKNYFESVAAIRT